MVPNYLSDVEMGFAVGAGNRALTCSALKPQGFAPKELAALAEELKAAPDPPALISRNGMAAKYAICEQALDIFCTYYGSEAGNLALKYLATGGVYVGGGIAVKILDKLKSSDFIQAFNRKGRMSALLAGIHVAVILNEHAGLIGAARAAAMAADR